MGTTDCYYFVFYIFLFRNFNEVHTIFSTFIAKDIALLLICLHKPFDPEAHSFQPFDTTHIPLSYIFSTRASLLSQSQYVIFAF